MENKLPLEKAIDDLKFMKDKSQDAFSDIIWGMAITICELHLEEKLPIEQKDELSVATKMPS